MITNFLPVRVYYEDTDHGGVVYYANYLKFMERGRTELLRARGYEQDVLIEKENLIFAVRSVKVDYIKPAGFNDLLVVDTRVSNASKVAFTFAQAIYKFPDVKRAEQVSAFTALPEDAVKLCQGEIKVVALAADSLRPKRVSENMVREIASE